MLKKIKKFKTHHKIIFAIIIGVSVVAFWRGSWGLMDVYLFPDNKELSSWTSFGIGTIILYFSHHLIKKLS